MLFPRTLLQAVSGISALSLVCPRAGFGFDPGHTQTASTGQAIAWGCYCGVKTKEGCVMAAPPLPEQGGSPMLGHPACFNALSHGTALPTVLSLFGCILMRVLFARRDLPVVNFLLVSSCR